MSPERHEKSQRRPPVSWRPCAGVQPQSSVQLVTYHACQLWGTTCCSACDHLLVKESHDTAVIMKAQGKATRRAWPWVPSVPVSCGWFCSCWLLESASEVKQRENDEKLKSLVHYIVFCGKQNIILANPTGFSGRVPENWTCYRATGNFVISTGFFYQPDTSIQKPDTSAQKRGFVSEPAL